MGGLSPGLTAGETIPSAGSGRMTPEGANLLEEGGPDWSASCWCWLQVGARCSEGALRGRTSSSPVTERWQRWRAPHPVAGPHGRAVRGGEGLCTVLPVLSELVLP